MLKIKDKHIKPAEIVYPEKHTIILCIILTKIHNARVILHIL